MIYDKAHIERTQTRSGKHFRSAFSNHDHSSSVETNSLCSHLHAFSQLLCFPFLLLLLNYFCSNGHCPYSSSVKKPAADCRRIPVGCATFTLKGQTPSQHREKKGHYCLSPSFEKKYRYVSNKIFSELSPNIVLEILMQLSRWGSRKMLVSNDNVLNDKKNMYYNWVAKMCGWAFILHSVSSTATLLNVRQYNRLRQQLHTPASIPHAHYLELKQTHTHATHVHQPSLPTTLLCWEKGWLLYQETSCSVCLLETTGALPARSFNNAE